MKKNTTGGYDIFFKKAGRRANGGLPFFVFLVSVF
jgi:hypothetical protein